MNTSRIQQLLILILSMSSVSLHSMEIIENEDNKKLLELVAYNIPHKYKIQRTFAGLNKEYNTIIEGTYRQDKKCIEQRMHADSMLAVPQQILWNKNFTQCAWAAAEEQGPCFFGTKKLKLWLVKLHDNRKSIIVAAGSFGAYRCAAIDDQLDLFFNKDGGMFCYGIDATHSRNGIISIIEYLLDNQGEQQAKCCRMRKIKGSKYTLNLLLNFPKLLKAFLWSTNIKESFYWESCIKRHVISGVTIPDNYKYYKQHSYGDKGVASYDDLPVEFQDVIDQLYAKQQQEKNNTNSPEK